MENINYSVENNFKTLSHQERCQIYCDKLSKSIHFSKNLTDTFLDEVKVPKQKVNSNISLEYKDNIDINAIVDNEILINKSQNIFINEIVLTIKSNG
jgi:hypothetical protein